MSPTDRFHDPSFFFVKILIHLFIAIVVPIVIENNHNSVHARNMTSPGGIVDKARSSSEVSECVHPTDSKVVQIRHLRYTSLRSLKHSSNLHVTHNVKISCRERKLDKNTLVLFPHTKLTA